MATLKENMEAIKLEKDTNLLPEHLKAGVTCLGVTGIMAEGVKLFETKEAMQADTTAKEEDIAIVHKTWGIAVTESGSFNGQNAIYFPKEVVSELVATLPITGSNLFRIITQNATVVITITEQNVSFNVTCEAYPMLDEYTTINIIYTKTNTGAIRTEINDGAGNVIEDTYDYIYVNTGGGTNWSSFWTDDINQFWHKITGKVVVGLYKFENEWIELPLAYSASTKDVSWSTLGDNVRYDNSNTFLGNNGFENGTLGKKGTITEDNWQTSLGITVSNNLQAMIDKLPDTNYSSTMQYTLVGFPVRSDGTSVIKFPSSTFSFNGNNNISYIPALNLGSVTNLYQSFIVCKQLLGVGKMDTSNVTNMRQTFMECSRLEDVAELDASKVTNMTYMFNLCPNLTDESLNNIMAMCSKATAYIDNGQYLTLREMGLSETQAQRCTTLSNYEAFTAAGWTTGY